MESLVLNFFYLETFPGTIMDNLQGEVSGENWGWNLNSQLTKVDLVDLPFIIITNQIYLGLSAWNQNSLVTVEKLSLFTLYNNITLEHISTGLSRMTLLFVH